MVNQDAIQWPKDTSPALLGSNWGHYLDTLKILSEFHSQHFRDATNSDSQFADSRSIPVEKLRPAAENMLAPADDHLSLFCDLLGFTAELKAEGSDSLPDYYGAAYVAAATYPSVQVYLLSDSLIAFAKARDVSHFVAFIARVVLPWRADGLLPQCFVGYGTFVQRKPVFGKQPSNFFGVQVAGTALIDAVDIKKTSNPLGSRILVSQSAKENLSRNQTCRIFQDRDRNLELVLGAGDRDCLFDCLYYFLCLRTLKAGCRIFEHYVWSVASRALDGSDYIFDLAVELAQPHYPDRNITAAADSARGVLQGYHEAK